MVIIECTEDKFDAMVGGLSEISQIAGNLVDCLSAMKESNEEREEYRMGGTSQSGGGRSRYNMGGNYNRPSMYRMGGRYGNY